MVFKIGDLDSDPVELEPSEQEMSLKVDPPPAAAALTRRARKKGVKATFSNDKLKIGDKEIAVSHEFVDPLRCRVWEGNARNFRALDIEAIEDIYDSIRTAGVLEPLLVRKRDDLYEVIDGSRRLFAAKTAGIDSIPVRVAELNDDEALLLTVVSNNSERLSPYEIGRFARSKKTGGVFQKDSDIWTHIGISKSNFYRCKNIASLPDYILSLYDDPRRVTLLGGDELYRAYKAYMASQDEARVMKKCLELSTSVVEESERTQKLVKWLALANSEKRPSRPALSTPKGRSKSYKNENGDVVLKLTNTAKGSTKIEVLVDDQDVKAKLLHMAKKLTGCVES